MIPKRLVRTVPETTPQTTEDLWEHAKTLHPDWKHVTHRDPCDPTQFPLTNPFWDDCETGAQLADLIRAEDLYHRGGFYIDSDVEMIRRLDPFCGCDGVAAWEDEHHIPNAVLGFRAGHPALKLVLDRAISARFNGTWAAGVGVTTEVFKNRDDIVLLPPGSFYAVPWREAHRTNVNWVKAAKRNPWAYCLHRYEASWH